MVEVVLLHCVLGAVEKCQGRASSGEQYNNNIVPRGSSYHICLVVGVVAIILLYIQTREKCTITLDTCLEHIPVFVSCRKVPSCVNICPSFPNSVYIFIERDKLEKWQWTYRYSSCWECFGCFKIMTGQRAKTQFADKGLTSLGKSCWFHGGPGRGRGTPQT